MIDIQQLPYKKLLKQAGIKIGDFLYDGRYAGGDYEQVSYKQYVLGFGRKSKSQLVYFEQWFNEKENTEANFENILELLLEICKEMNYKNQIETLIDNSEQFIYQKGNYQVEYYLDNGMPSGLIIRDLELIEKNKPSSLKKLEKLSDVKDSFFEKEIKNKIFKITYTQDGEWNKEYYILFLSDFFIRFGDDYKKGNRNENCTIQGTHHYHYKLLSSKKNVFRIKFLPADYLLEEAEISFAENLLVVNFSNYDFEQYDKYRILAADEYIQLKSNYKLLEGLDI